MTSTYELCRELMTHLVRAGLMPEIPFIDVVEIAADWARANPEQAENLARELYQQLKVYFEGG